MHQKLIVGIDEVGRGCWAGPLVAAAVLIRKPIEGLRDSKLISRKKREYLYDLIMANSDVGVGWVEASIIDKIGLTEAVRNAMSSALAEIKCSYDEVIIDGDYNYLDILDKSRCLIKADSLVDAVSAASIVAKVLRDRFMFEMATKYSKYGFEKHVGYGTDHHKKMLIRFGTCELHRLSYKPVRAINENQ